MKEILNRIGNVFLIVFSVGDKKLFALRAALFLVPCLVTAFGTYFYMMHLAVPHTPPEGHVFPREPVLIGTYRYEAPGGKAYRSGVDQTSIVCGFISYFAGTLAQAGEHGDCGLKKELHGKIVRVDQVTFPTLNPKAGPVAVRIVSNGKVYYDRSDAWVREQWIWNTERAASSTVVKLTLFVGMLAWLAAEWITKRIEQGRKQ